MFEYLFFLSGCLFYSNINNESNLINSRRTHYHQPKTCFVNPVIFVAAHNIFCPQSCHLFFANAAIYVAVYT